MFVGSTLNPDTLWNSKMVNFLSCRHLRVLPVEKWAKFEADESVSKIKTPDFVAYVTVPDRMCDQALTLPSSNFTTPGKFTVLKLKSKLFKL